MASNLSQVELVAVVGPLVDAVPGDLLCLALFLLRLIRGLGMTLTFGPAVALAFGLGIASDCGPLEVAGGGMSGGL